MANIITIEQDFNNRSAVNLPAPVNDQDAATKEYVDETGGAITLQQALDNGSVLDKGNTIDADIHPFFIESKGSIIISTVVEGSEDFASFATNNDSGLTAAFGINVGGNPIVILITSAGATLLKNGAQKKLLYLNVEDDYANDGAAAAGGIEVGELYHTSGSPKLRLT